MAHPTCSVPLCEYPTRTPAAVLCVAHYYRKRRTGSVGGAPVRKYRRFPETLFMRFRFAEHGCFIWTGETVTGGYGRIRVGSKNVLAHRAAYQLVYGPVPDGLEVDHLCGNPSCINPGHLEAVTHQENVRRARCQS